MLWSDRPTRLTGIVLIAFAITIVVAVIAGGIAGGDGDPFARDEIDDLLIDMEESRGAAIVSLIFSILGHAGFGIAAAAALYLLLRDRGRAVALSGFAFILLAQAVWLIEDASYNLLINLASDFADGGPEGVAAGDLQILRDARTVGILASSAQILGVTALGLGIIAFSAIIGWAQAGSVNPPRWLGWVGLIAGVTAVLSWLVALGDFGGIFFGLSGLFTLIWLVGLGVWLLRQREDDHHVMEPARV
jgi:hypothetical protein